VSIIDKMKNKEILKIEINIYIMLYYIYNKCIMINIINFKNNVPQVFGSNL